MRGAVRAGLPGYLGTLTIVTALILAPALVALAHFGVGEATLWLLALLGLVPASEAALTLVNRFVTTRVGPRALPGLELRDGRPVEPAHAGRRAHSLDDAGGARGADRAARSPRAGEPRRRSPLRAALGLDGLRYGARARRRRAPRRGQRGDRTAESTPWTRAGRRPLPAAPSPAGLERRRGQVDRLGTQAREAPRAESIAARRERHDLHRSRRRAARRARRRPLRDHARRRHPTASRSCATARREDGPSAQPSEARWPQRPCGRGPRGASAAGHAVAADGSRGLALPARLLGSRRDGPLRVRRLRRLPGSLRGRLLQRKGQLRRGRLRGRARGADPGQHSPESRPLRGDLRPGRARLGHRGRRGLPLALRRRRGEAASLGARRLAAAALDLRLWTRLEAARPAAPRFR